MHIKVTASGSRGKLQVLECHQYNNDGKEVGYKFINAKLLKDKGIIKKFPGYKKADEFLNTDEGLRFYEEAKHTPLI